LFTSPTHHSSLASAISLRALAMRSAAATMTASR
jgi:hypothetical protein